MRVLEVIHYFLIFDKFGQRFNILDSVFDHLAWFDGCLVTDDVCAVEHLEEAGFHDVGVVVFLWRKPHLIQSFSRDLDIKLQREYVLQKLGDLGGLLWLHL